VLKSELESAHGIKATVIAADLAQPDSAEKIFAATEAADLQIDILINNAGFGGYGNFHESDLAKDQSMMQVNMVSLVNLTHLYLQGMVSRNSGKILHVASTAAFMAGRCRRSIMPPLQDKLCKVFNIYKTAHC
jgi:hypothetical protein